MVSLLLKLKAGGPSALDVCQEFARKRLWGKQPVANVQNHGARGLVLTIRGLNAAKRAVCLVCRCEFAYVSAHREKRNGGRALQRPSRRVFLRSCFV